MMKSNRLACVVLAALLSLQTLPAYAAKPDTASAVEASAPNSKNASTVSEDEIAKQTITGPAVIDLSNQAKLKLPAKMVFIKKDAANSLMEEWGNGTNPDRYGLIIPEQKNKDSAAPWWVDLNFNDSGYIKDDDAKEWDVEGMLKQLKEGSEEQNKERAARNLPELETRGWVEKPQYDAKTHRLIWSIDVFGIKNETRPPILPSTTILSSLDAKAILN